MLGHFMENHMMIKEQDMLQVKVSSAASCNLDNTHQDSSFNCQEYNLTVLTPGIVRAFRHFVFRYT
jgi:hypothetical protein